MKSAPFEASDKEVTSAQRIPPAHREIASPIDKSTLPL